MIASLLVLTGMLIGQGGGPVRGWHIANLNGQNVKVWGWIGPTGGVQYYTAENPQLFKSSPKPVGTNTGLVVGADGNLNAGLNLGQSAAKPDHQLQTNDPNLGDKIGLNAEAKANCPNEPSEPEVPDLEPPAPVPPDLTPYLIPGAMIVVALILVLAFAPRRHD